MRLILVGKTQKDSLVSLVRDYQKRISKYFPLEVIYIPDNKFRNLPLEQLKQKEGEQILKKISSDDLMILLDEKGKQKSSVEFSYFISERMQEGLKKTVFVIGGSFGFSEQVYSRANQKLGLSKMTFSHQMIRVFFLEQIYRAITIIKNIPYHNE